MATLQGTAIKNTGYLDKVYFNTSIPTEEVIAVLEKLTYTSGSYDVCYGTNGVRVNIAKHDSYYSIACAKDKFYDMPFNTDPQYVNETAGIVSTGWKTSFDNEGFGNPFEIDSDLLSESNGGPIGSQNELLKNLISSTPFEAITLDGFLTDLADSIRYVKGTEEKVNAQNYSSEIRKFKGGTGSSNPIDNGPIHEGKYRVRYFDTDGTILKIEYVESGGKTTPPDNPSYDPDYLIFAEWNYDTDNYIVEQPTDIGAIYDTVDDATYMFCRFTAKTGLNPTLAITGATAIDWADGAIDTNVSHTYANEGEYLIKIYGDINFNTFSLGNLLGSADLNSALKKCYIKSGIKKLENNNFIDCASLFAVSIPKTVDYIYSSAFSSCRSLIYVSIPNNIENISDSMFYNCSGLISVSIPNSVKTIMNFAFQNCYSLINIIIPDGVTNIGNSAFQRCFCVRDFIFNCNSIPTLANSAGFTYMSNSSIMWFKDSIINGIKTATNWTTWSSYMKPLSWYPSLTNPNA